VRRSRDSRACRSPVRNGLALLLIALLVSVGSARGLIGATWARVPAIVADEPAIPRIVPDDLARALRDALAVPAAHAAEIGEEAEPPKAPGAIRRQWDKVKDTPLMRRVRTITGWIAAAARFVWAIPKAILEGDSDALIEALGGILARASAAETSEAPRATAPALGGPARAAFGTGLADTTEIR